MLSQAQGNEPTFDIKTFPELKLDPSYVLQRAQLDSLGNLWLYGMKEIKDPKTGKNERVLLRYDGQKFANFPLTENILWKEFDPLHRFEFLSPQQLAFYLPPSPIVIFEPFSGKSQEIQYQGKQLALLSDVVSIKGRRFFIGEFEGVKYLFKWQHLLTKMNEVKEELIYAGLYEVGDRIWLDTENGLFALNEDGNFVDSILYDSPLMNPHWFRYDSKGNMYFYNAKGEVINLSEFPKAGRSCEKSIVPLYNNKYQDEQGNLILFNSNLYDIKYLGLLKKGNTKLIPYTDLLRAFSTYDAIASSDYTDRFFLLSDLGLLEVKVINKAVQTYLEGISIRKLRHVENHLQVETELKGVYALNYESGEMKTINREVSFGRNYHQTGQELIYNNDRVLYVNKQGIKNKINFALVPEDLLRFNDSIYVYGRDDFLLRVNIDRNQVDTIRFHGLHKIQQLVKQDENKFYLVHGGGLSLLTINGEEVKSFALEGAANCLNSDDKHLYVGDGKGGVWKIDKSNDQVSKIATLGRPIASLTLAENKLWIATFSGLYAFDLNAEKLFFAKDETLENTEFNRHSNFFSKANAILYLGSLQKLLAIDLKSLVLSDPITPIQFTSVRQYNSHSGKDTIIYLFGTEDVKLVIDAYHSGFTLNFSQGLKSENKNLILEYQLKQEAEDNSEETWISNGQNMQLSFSNLAAGDYELWVRNRDLSSGINSHIRKIHIHANGYFYDAWWFRGLILFIIGMIAFFWIRRLNTEKTRLDREVTLRTAELQTERETIKQQAKTLQELNDNKDKFYTNISHEIKTPLTLVNGPIDQLLTFENYQPDQLKLLNIAKRNTNILTERVQELLELTRLENKKESPDLSPCSLDFLVNQEVKIFEPVAVQTGLLLQSNVSGKTDQLFWMDNKRLGKVVQNLLANALKYNTSGQKVEIDLKLAHDSLSIEVSDDGPGIPFEDQAKIFEKYYQVQNDKSDTNPGAGIGLALVKEIVQLLNGQIKLESEPGHGSKFLLELPVKMIEWQEANLSMTTEQVNKLPDLIMKGKKPSILIVDDHEELRNYIGSLLSTSCHIELAENGLDAWEKIYQNAFDLIISDIMMPKMDGLTLLTKTRQSERFHNIPFIFLSARRNEAIKAEAFRAGVDDYLTKPFSYIELIVRMQRLLERSLVRKENNEIVLAESDHPNMNNDDRLNQINAIILRDMGKPTFSVLSIAEQLSINQKTLLRFLKSNIGLSPKEYVNELQMETLRRLKYERPGLSINELGSLVGFTDSRYMIQKYFERFGEKLK